MHKFSVQFLDYNAIDYQGSYSKNDIFESIKVAREESTIKSVKKHYNTTLDLLVYTFRFNTNTGIIKIPKSYIDNNKEYIETFEKWSLQDSKTINKARVGLVTLGVVSIFSAGVKLSGPVYQLENNIKNVLIDIFDNPIDNLDREIRIHTGYERTDDGRKVLEELGHDCVLNIDESEKADFNVDEKAEAIKRYCDEYDLGEEVAYEAVRKLNYYRDDEEDLAKDINLKAIYKESVKDSKTK